MASSQKGGKHFLLYIVIGVVVVAIAGYAVFSFVLPATSLTKTSTTPANNVYLSLTDPATVPVGTTALFITYSDVQLLVSSNGTLSTVSLPGGTGTVNVLDLQNAFLVLGAMHLSNGSKIIQIEVNITSTIITINGVNSTVVIGEGTVKANITSGNSVAGTTTAVIDLVPSVTSIQTVDKTIYVLTPSVRAVITPNNVFTGQSSNVSGSPSSLPPVGRRINFTKNTNLSNIFKSVTPTIKITSASITVNGNDTSFSITVENTGNASVELNGIMINGSKNVYFPAPPTSLLFHMPPSVFPMPILPPNGQLPSGVNPPPKFIITFPNGTIMNTTGTFNMQNPRPLPLPQNVTNGTVPPLGSISQTGTFYLLDLVNPAYAISINSTGALLNVGGEEVIETSTLPMPSQPNSGSQRGPINITIPAGSTTIVLPAGTTLYVQFPPGISPPKPPTLPTNQAQQMLIGRLILSNGTLGFPPISLISNSGPAGAPNQGAPGNGTTAINNAASRLVTNGASNFTAQIPKNEVIPPGYVLAAGASFTFTLSGQLLLGPAPQVQANAAGGASGITIEPPFAVLISGDAYTVNLFGASGAHAVTQVVAT